jgi:hypothetical protein
MPIVENSRCSMMLLRNLQEYWDGNFVSKNYICDIEDYLKYCCLHPKADPDTDPNLPRENTVKTT